MHAKSMEVNILFFEIYDISKREQLRQSCT